MIEKLNKKFSYSSLQQSLHHSHDVVLFKGGVYVVQCKRANGHGNNLRAGSI